MATIQLNAGLQTRWESGGKLTITYSGNDYVINNVKPGTLKIEPGGKERLTAIDRGVLQTPILGDQRQSKISVTCRIAGASIEDATGLVELSQADDDSAGTPKTFTVQIFIPDKPYAATGNTETFANCWFDKPAMLSAGQDFDELQLEIVSNTHKAVTAAV